MCNMTQSLGGWSSITVYVILCSNIDICCDIRQLFFLKELLYINTWQEKVHYYTTLDMMAEHTQTNNATDPMV